VSGRRAKLGWRGLVALGSVATTVAWLTFSPAWAPASIAAPSCSYVERGAPGPGDNVLQIDEPEFGSVEVRRSGSEILVLDRTPPKKGEVVSCSGPQATVNNIDQVHVTMAATEPTGYTFFYLDEGGGMLGPGATPESDGQSEIEVQVEPTSDQSVPYVKLIGQSGPDQQVIDDQNRALIADLDGSDPVHDPELTVQGAAFLDVYGGAGDDTVSVPWTQALDHVSIKGQGGYDNLAGNGSDMSGGAGNDTIHGGWFGEFLNGGSGNDRIYGGGSSWRRNGARPPKRWSGEGHPPWRARQGQAPRRRG
jgi:hypothetical protein